MFKEICRTLVFLFFVTISFGLPEGARDKKEKYTVCRTKECRELAALYKKTIDFSVAPCDDFLTFTCGIFNNESKIAPNRIENGVIGTIREKVDLEHIELLKHPKMTRPPRNAMENVRAYFQACVEAEYLTQDEVREVVINILKDLGGMPLVPSTEYDPEIDYLAKIAISFRTFGVDRIIGLDVGLDLLNASKRLITFTQMESFGIPRPILIRKDKESKRTIRAYQQYIKHSICLILECNNINDIDEEVQKIVQFETSLAKIALPPEKRSDFSTRFKKLPVRELQKKFPKIPFLRYLNEVFKEVNIKFGPNHIVGFLDPEYYAKLAGVIESVEEETLMNYLGWRMYQAIPVFNTISMKNYTFQINQVLSGIKVPPKRERTCADTVSEDFPLSLGKIYVKKYFSKKIKDELEEFMKYLRISVKDMLVKNEWMDNLTKKQALKKLASIQEHIGYPKWLEYNLTKLEEEEGLPEPFDKSAYIESVIKLKRYRVSQALLEYKKPVDREEWTASPATVNAFYNSIKNCITFPAGILQKPLFRLNTLKSVNYGAIGTIIGHEITHGFDNIGNQFDENGNLRNWWTNKTKEEFNIRKKCYVDQYGNVTDKQTGLQLNGAMTVGENIADNGGIRGAYEAYMMTNPQDERLPGLEHITHKQIFFISNAKAWCGTYRTEALRNRILTDSHPPIQYRAFMPARNSKAFAEAFNCPPGSPMNPTEKCELW